MHKNSKQNLSSPKSNVNDILLLIQLIKMNQSSRKTRKTIPLEKEAPFFQCSPSQPRAETVKGERLINDVKQESQAGERGNDMLKTANKVETASRSHLDL